MKSNLVHCIIIKFNEINKWIEAYQIKQIQTTSDSKKNVVPYIEPYFDFKFSESFGAKKEKKLTVWNGDVLFCSRNAVLPDIAAKNQQSPRLPENNIIRMTKHMVDWI